jgi:hypothetical protein
LQALLKTIIDGIREDFGQPVSLIRLLADHPEIRVSLDTPPPFIAAESIVPWHELGTAPYAHHPHRERGTLLGWKMRDKDNYGSFTLHRPEYEQIGHREITEHWACDYAFRY